MFSIYYRYRYSRLGLRLGFSIDPDAFGYGLTIPHYGTIVIGTNTIGNYAVLHVSTCISGNNKTIGDGLYLSTGAKITSKITLGNGVSVGANSLVNCSFDEDNILIGGVPAKFIKDREIWYKEENSIHYQRVQKIEAIKQRMFL